MLHEFEYRAPATRAELLDLLADGGGTLLAGGTDVLVNIRGGWLKPARVIDVKRVAGWGGVTWSERDGLAIHPATTIREVLDDSNVRQRFPLLAECARDLASPAIRNRATVIGNIVNASPCADMAPALLCLGASAVIASKAGQRAVAMREFFTGVRKTVLARGEMLERIVIPAASAGARGAYRKLKRIAGHDLGLVGVAVMKQQGRLALGISSAAPTPLLVDGLGESEPAEKVVAAARAAIQPISDVRCSKEYRAHMVEVYVRRLLQEVK